MVDFVDTEHQFATLLILLQATDASHLGEFLEGAVIDVGSVLEFSMLVFEVKVLVNLQTGVELSVDCQHLTVLDEIVRHLMRIVWQHQEEGL